MIYFILLMVILLLFYQLYKQKKELDEFIDCILWGDLDE